MLLLSCFSHKDTLLRFLEMDLLDVSLVDVMPYKHVLIRPKYPWMPLSTGWTRCPASASTCWFRWIVGRLASRSASGARDV